MEEHPIKEDRHQHQPEHQPDTEEEPRHLGVAEMHPTNRHDDVSYHRNKPRRIDVRDLKAVVMHPDAHDGQGHNQMQRRANDPKHFGQPRRQMQKARAEQNQADGDRREEVHPDRVLHLFFDSFRVLPPFHAVHHEQKGKHRQRDNRQQRADRHPNRQHRLGFFKRQRQSAEAHDHREKGVGEMLQA